MADLTVEGYIEEMRAMVRLCPEECNNRCKVGNNEWVCSIFSGKLENSLSGFIRSKECLESEIVKLRIEMGILSNYDGQ